MRVQLGGAVVTPEKQRANDTHRPIVAAAVLGVLLVYAYLFTPLSLYLGLPRPYDLLKSVEQLFRFRSAGILWSRIEVTETLINYDRALLIFFGLLAASFLCAYFAPLRYKRPTAAGWFLIGFFVFYGLFALLLLLTAHIAVYLTFHPKARESRYLSALLGALVPFTALHASWLTLFVSAVGAGAAAAIYHFALVPLLRRSRFAKVARVIVIQMPMIFGLFAVAWEGLGGAQWTLPLGILFFIWQWERLMVYHVDHATGDVPEDLPFLVYLSVFMTPVILTNWHSSHYIPQAYSYLSSRFLNRDKNAIVMGGLRLWGVALLYLAISRWFVQGVEFFSHLTGIPVYGTTATLVQSHLKGTPMRTPTVLLSTLSDQIRVFFAYGALTHFRVGAWRTMGHDVDPQYNRPWMATNLVSFWSRWAFHYREFLVRTFYYPAFFRFFKGYLYLRVFVATMIATSIGNHIWGHVPVRIYGRGLTTENLISILRAWPYYLLLGLGISLTQLYLMRRGRTRRPWTRDRRFVLDILAAYCTFQYFCVIHIFARPQPHGTLKETTRLFLIGLGIHL